MIVIVAKYEKNRYLTSSLSRPQMAKNNMVTVFLFPKYFKFEKS